MADRYARNNHAAYTPPPCKLCGKPLAVDWIDDTRVADASPWDVPVLRSHGCYLPCPRCGNAAHVVWLSIGDDLIPGRSWCETPGCVDESGSNHVPIAEAP